MAADAQLGLAWYTRAGWERGALAAIAALTTT